MYINVVDEIVKRKGEDICNDVVVSKKRKGSVSSGYTSSIFSKGDREILNRKYEDRIQTFEESETFSGGVESFDDLGIDSDLVSSIQRLGYCQSTPIQELVIRNLEGQEDNNDIFIKSNTGTGKTMSYIVPIINYLLKITTDTCTRSYGTFCIIITPTRELSVQLQNVINSVIQNMKFIDGKGVKRPRWIVPGYFLSGISRSKEKLRLRLGTTIVIGTPGRILDHLENTKNWQLNALKYVVVEECDKFLEKGLISSIHKLFLSIHEKHHIDQRLWRVLFISATYPKEFKALTSIGGISIKGPLVIGDEIEENNGVNKRIAQNIICVPLKLKFVTLLSILSSPISHTIRSDKNVCKVILFVSTCYYVDFLYSLFESFNDVNAKDGVSYFSQFLGCRVLRLHGSLGKVERLGTYESFSRCKNTENTLLITTNVSSRGLDFRSTDLIIQYDLPSNSEDYTHKAGRTGRLEEIGVSILFLLPHERECVVSLIKNSSCNKDVHLSEIDPRRTWKLSRFDSKYLGVAMNAFKTYIKANMGQDVIMDEGFEINETEKFLIGLQLIIEEKLEGEEELKEQARNAFLSYTKFYTTFPSDMKKKGSIFLACILDTWPKVLVSNIHPNT